MAVKLLAEYDISCEKLARNNSSQRVGPKLGEEVFNGRSERRGDFYSYNLPKEKEMQSHVACFIG